VPYLLSLIIPMAAAAVDAEHKDTRTLISWNVLEGFQRGTTADDGAAWLDAQAPDIAAFQELMDIVPDEFAALAKRWGHPYSVMQKAEGHPVGLSSNTPIEVIEKRTAGMHHGYLHAVTHGIHFFVLHLAPGRPRREKRKEEAAIMVKAIQPLLDKGGKVAVLGDFNDLSPLDPIPTMRGEKPDTWDYTVMRRFLDTGLLDVCHDIAVQRGKSPSNTCPTRLDETADGKAEQDRGSWRIDYVLVSPALRENVVNAFSPRGGLLEKISDHYPVVVKIRK
jgi:exodeoxyribonuclease III